MEKQLASAVAWYKDWLQLFRGITNKQDAGSIATFVRGLSQMKDKIHASTYKF